MVRRTVEVAALAAACGALACLAYVSPPLASGAATPAAELLQRQWQPLSALQTAERRQRESLLAAGAPGFAFSPDNEVGVVRVLSRGRGLGCWSLGENPALTRDAGLLAGVGRRRFFSLSQWGTA